MFRNASCIVSYRKFSVKNNLIYLAVNFEALMDIPWHSLTIEKTVTKFYKLWLLSKKSNKAFKKRLWKS